MIVLTTLTSTQTIKFRPRQGTQATVMYLTNESTNERVSVAIDSYTVGSYYDTITARFNLVENVYYTLKLETIGDENNLQDFDFEIIQTASNDNIEIEGYVGTNILTYYGKVFCSNQTSTYTVNANTYTTKNSNNNFIFL